MSCTIYVPFWNGEAKPDVDCAGFSKEEVCSKLHEKYNMIYRVDKSEIAKVFNIIEVVVINQ